MRRCKPPLLAPPYRKSAFHSYNSSFWRPSRASGLLLIWHPRALTRVGTSCRDCDSHREMRMAVDKVRIGIASARSMTMHSAAFTAPPQTSTALLTSAASQPASVWAKLTPQGFLFLGGESAEESRGFQQRSNSAVSDI